MSGAADPVDLLLDTPHGEARWVIHPAGDPVAVLALGHGAGNGVESRDLAALAACLPEHDVTVALFEQPWRRRGAKVATAPPTLDVAFAAGVADLARHGSPDTDTDTDSAAGAPTAGLPGVPDAVPLLVGGRSAGARSAARTARAVGAAGCVALAFPLHPPGRPERSRLAELADADVPLLVVQGERDSMGRPEEFPDLLPGGVAYDLVTVPGADHGMAVARRGPLTQEEALDVVVEAVLEWVTRQVVGNAPRRP